MVSELDKNLMLKMQEACDGRESFAGNTDKPDNPALFFTGIVQESHVG